MGQVGSCSSHGMLTWRVSGGWFVTLKTRPACCLQVARLGLKPHLNKWPAHRQADPSMFVRVQNPQRGTSVTGKDHRQRNLALC